MSSINRIHYSCTTPITAGSTCNEPESYRAKNNTAERAHLCAKHWAALSENERAHYVEVQCLNPS